jgi:antirestriction protein
VLTESGTVVKGCTMNEDDIGDRNTGKEWSEMDFNGLANSVRLKNSIEEIATFLCRSRREVRDKIAELERSGELAGRIEETAANAQPE